MQLKYQEKNIPPQMSMGTGAILLVQMPAVPPVTLIAKGDLFTFLCLRSLVVK